jgi:hypothetical protein
MDFVSEQTKCKGTSLRKQLLASPSPACVREAARGSQFRIRSRPSYEPRYSQPNDLPPICPVRESVFRLTPPTTLTNHTAALRLYPPVPLNFRTASRDAVLPTGGGPDASSPFLVSKGQTIAFSAYCLHRRRDLYGEDAESFRPERWDDAMFRSLTSRRAYIPFYAGPRTCIGGQYAKSRYKSKSY